MSMTGFAGLEAGVLNYEGMKVYPRGFHKYGQDVVEPNVNLEKADIAISLMDAWVCEPDMYPNVRWIPWFPIDSEPLTEINANKVSRAYKRLVFSKHGCRMMDLAGMDYDYIPHGVDTNIFKPVDRVQARETCHLPKDAFIVGMVAANVGFPPRKAFAENILGFAMFKMRHPDAILYLHTTNGSHGEGFDIIEYLKFVGLRPGIDVIISDQYQLWLGLPDNLMNALYNSFDVHLLCSKGEGFGIPILEAQSAGCPVIVGDWTSMGELCFSGWKLDKLTESEPEYTQYGAYWYVPHSRAIADRLELAYAAKGNIQYRNRARVGALKYDADKITEKYWIPYLDKVYDEIYTNPKHVHQWSKIGLYNEDHSISRTCLGCYDELKNNTVIKDGFNNHPNGIEIKVASEPKDGVSKIIMREIERDYHIDLDIQEGKIIEIGSHIGLVTTYLSKKYPNSQIVGFEPSKANYDHLLLNLEANQVKNAVIVNKAVTSDGRNVTISTDFANSGGGNIYQGGGEVESVKAGDLFNQPIELLKIDCEGAEYEIFDSLTDDQLKNIKAIRGEFHSAFGNAQMLLERVQSLVPNTVVTVN